MEGEAEKELGEDKRGKAHEENKRNGNEYDPVNHQSEEDFNKSTLQGHSQPFEVIFTSNQNEKMSEVLLRLALFDNKTFR